MPTAVQVSAATRISFSENLVRELGQVGLGLGNDVDAHASGIGIGVTDSAVDDNLVNDVAKDHKETSGILSTSADHTVIDHPRWEQAEYFVRVASGSTT